MLSNPLIATVLVFALIALGEWLSIVSRARVPMLLTAMVGFLILTWTGIFPKDILEKSQFAALGAILIGPAIVHMGTMIPFSLVKTQYKAVLIALSGVIVSAILILLIVPLLFDYPTAVAGVGPISGGIIALLITSEKLKEIGMTSIVIIPALVVAFQGVVGMPLAMHFMKKYAKVIQAQLDDGTFVSMGGLEEESEVTAAAKKNPLRSSAVLKLFFVFAGAGIGTLLGSVTPIHYTLWCLLIGIVGLKLGVFQSSELERANSFTITMIGIIFVVIGTMAGVTPGQVLTNLPAIIAILAIGSIGISIGGYTMAKLLKWHPFKGMPVALTALFGFPGDYILCEEVSRSCARNEKEEKLIFNELLAPMVIGGFTTVTVASVIIAGVLIKTL
ncbi:hypothetical protein NCCP2716_17630 [Sporosarcina sp. NCCP-2716]|uniref:hypothetical protein n=1 Tax=Sporosarcina sp. NCCP-2716 TaxID=2943679 RepID=UPI00203AA6F8|nr:hypothetical protein [Sporosarcina sp. NCCP-2716]GKV69265.1 hypothetical protein NCCP2716_17630 [Sporosarcina sp. NCCP-2716]